MAFRSVEFSELVQRSPHKASKVLSDHYAVHGNARAVATAMGVGVNTLKRWLTSIVAAGHPLRVGVRRRRGWPLGKPRGPDIALNLRGREKRLRRP